MSRQSLRSKGQEVAIVIEQDRRGRLLVIVLIAWIKYLNARFARCFERPGCYPVAAGTRAEVDRDNVGELGVFQEECHLSLFREGFDLN